MKDRLQSLLLVLSVTTFFISITVAIYTDEFLWFLGGIIAFAVIGVMAAFTGNDDKF